MHNAPPVSATCNLHHHQTLSDVVCMCHHQASRGCHVRHVPAPVDAAHLTVAGASTRGSLIKQVHRYRAPLHASMLQFHTYILPFWEYVTILGLSDVGK
jgi:hypothetical protein